jgi:hypothetical protein
VGHDDAWITAIGQLAREQATADRAQAAAGEVPAERASDAAYAAALAIPLDEAAQERIVASLLAGPAPRRAASRRVSRGVWTAGLIAAAAAIAVAVFAPRSSEPVAQLGPLPTYALTVHGDLQATRSGASRPGVSPLRIRDDTELELVLRPSTRTPEGIEVSVLWHAPDGWIELPWDRERSDSGVFRVHGNAVALRTDGAPSRGGELALMVCRPGSCERGRAALVASSAHDGYGWQVFRLPYVFDSSAQP